MLLKKQALELHRVASKESTRYTLQGVYIEHGGKATATNGITMVQYIPENTPDTKDYPVVDGMKIDYGNDPQPLKPFILPSESCRDVLKALPKKNIYPALLHVALDEQATNNNGRVVMAVNTLDDVKRFSPKKIDGQYPDYTKVIPTDQPACVVGLAIDKVMEVLETLKACGVESVKIGIYDERRPIKIKGANKDGDHLVGLVMPVRLDTIND